MGKPHITSPPNHTTTTEVEDSVFIFSSMLHHHLSSFNHTENEPREKLLRAVVVPRSATRRMHQLYLEHRHR